MKKPISLFLILFFIQILDGQNPKADRFWDIPDTLNKKRLYGLLATGAAAYTGTVIILDRVWYKDYKRTAFRTFDDWGEWENMDKIGHILTAYVETKWAYGAYRWTGLSHTKAALCGMATGTVLQTTLEVLDGFSEGWGFSWYDIIANTSGCALFGLQQAAWQEQRILLKVANFPKKYPKTPIKAPDGSYGSLYDRTVELYGSNYALSFFKDYNAINWWASINPASFRKGSRFPAWLNIAVGYSAENIFGAYGNVVYSNTGQSILPDPSVYPRYRQYFLSLDIDLSRIKTKNKFLRSVFRTFNFIKIPAPAIEYNSLGKFKFHPIIW